MRLWCTLAGWRTVLSLEADPAGWLPACAAGKGRRVIAEALQLCEESPLEGEADVRGLRDWAASAWDYLVSSFVPAV